MWGKVLRLAALSVIALSKTYSQTYPGYRTSNYTGVDGVFFNPSEIADNRFKWDVNLASINGFVGTNQGGLKFSDITKSFNASDLRSRFLLGKTNINSLDFVDILGPSVMISLSPKTSVALTTHSRAFGNARDVDGNLASAIIDPKNSGLTAPVPLSGANSLVHATGWTDIGGSVAQVFTNKGSHHFFKGGITLKYILGTADTYMTTQLNGSVGPGSPAAELIGPVSGNIFFNTAGTDFTDYTYKDFFKFNGQGFGGDIGFVYEFRPDMDYSMYTNDRWANKYKLKIGVSLMDVGTIHFNKPENQAANYTTHIPAGQNYSLIDFQGKSVSSFIPVFNASPQYFTPGEAQNSSYDVKLPTTIQANIDYLIGRNTNFAVNIAGQFNINNQKNFNLFYYNAVTITPRWENPLVSVGLPLSYNQLTQFNAGIFFRIGPFFIGSGSVISTLFHESRQADLYLGLNWGIQFKKKIRPDTDKDGVYDDVDKCPTVFGYARYQGCPIPDTDGDGINDEEDSCKTVPGVAKYHGCPIPDTDKDGVNDEEDSCVNTPGLPQFHGCPDTDGDGIPDPEDKCPTVPGVAKYQGCPVPDQDKDGVPDDVDLCPTIPGPAETHGCPITEVLLKITADFKNILFNTGKATLQSQSEEIISRAAVIMKEQIPNSSFYIDGYTDNVGSAAVNKRLSKARAQAVVNALIADGVNKSRLVARGFGKEYPKCSNTTAEGRQCNRRVEVVIRNVNETEQKNSIEGK
jgi:outer membrane protein OmpA-like peptidoglycan-associated protein